MARPDGERVFSIGVHALASGWGFARHVPDQQAGDQVEQQGHHKQHQGHFDQGFGVQLVDRFGKLVGDDAGHGVAGAQQGRRAFDAVADHHGDRHGLAKGASQPQDHRAQDAGQAVGDEHLPDGFPLGGAQGQRSFALGARDGQEHVPGNRRDGGDDHDSQDQAGSQAAGAAGGDRPVEERTQNGEAAQAGGQKVSKGGNHLGQENENTPQAVDHAGDGRQQLDHPAQAGSQPAAAKAQPGRWRSPG